MGRQLRFLLCHCSQWPPSVGGNPQRAYLGTESGWPCPLWPHSCRYLWPPSVGGNREGDQGMAPTLIIALLVAAALLPHCCSLLLPGGTCVGWPGATSSLAPALPTEKSFCHLGNLHVTLLLCRLSHFLLFLSCSLPHSWFCHLHSPRFNTKRVTPLGLPVGGI